jgi:zinc transport system ATP-binding protein
MTKIIEAARLNFSYQETPVLKDVNFVVEKGEFVGIIGPNGGGKTTLLKLILGFLKPTSGKLLVFGENPEEVTTKLAYVPQSMRFDRQFPISVFELVLTGCLSRLNALGQYGQAEKQAALRALEKVDLAEFKNAPFGTLSGGQAQRALIARALVSDPHLLLLDEPTASVDAQAEADIYALLQTLKGNMTILMVTHDLRAAIDQVEKVICVQGSVVTLKPQEVCEHFAIGLYHPPLIPLGKKP